MSEHYTHPAPDLRASDADRESMAEQLRRHHADGRLDTDEFQERIDRCYDARTVGELGALTTDLPRAQEVSRRRSGAALSARRLWALPVVPIVIALIVVGAIAGHHGHSGAWGGFWVVIPALMIARLILFRRRAYMRSSRGAVEADRSYWTEG